MAVATTRRGREKSAEVGHHGNTVCMRQVALRMTNLTSFPIKLLRIVHKTERSVSSRVYLFVHTFLTIPDL